MVYLVRRKVDIMFKNRMEHLLQKTAVDAVYITSPENLFYYSGFTGGEGALVITGREPALFTDSRYFVQAREEAPDFTVIDITKTRPTAYIKDFAPKQIGYEEDFVSAKAAKDLYAAMPDSRWVDVGAAILAQHAVKSKEERAILRRAAALADDAFAKVLPLIKPGVSERDIALELEWSMRKGGASGPSFPIICASGHRSCMPHGVASEKKLAVGDFITMDFGCFLKGYASDMTRTVVLGKASNEQKKVYETVLCAQNAALEILRAGLRCADADNAARTVIQKAGHGAHFGHSLGHGVGLLIHEQPTLSPRSETVLAAGMAVTVEPGIYIENFGGVRIEDLVIITETGYENLTHSEKTLLEI